MASKPASPVFLQVLHRVGKKILHMTLAACFLLVTGVSTLVFSVLTHLILSTNPAVIATLYILCILILNSLKLLLGLVWHLISSALGLGLM